MGERRPLPPLSCVDDPATSVSFFLPFIVYGTLLAKLLCQNKKTSSSTSIPTYSHLAKRFQNTSPHPPDHLAMNENMTQIRQLCHNLIFDHFILIIIIIILFTEKNKKIMEK